MNAIQSKLDLAPSVLELDKTWLFCCYRGCGGFMSGQVSECRKLQLAGKCRVHKRRRSIK